MATQNRFGFDVCRYLNTPTMGERLQMMIGAVGNQRNYR